MSVRRRLTGGGSGEDPVPPAITRLAAAPAPEPKERMWAKPGEKPKVAQRAEPKTEVDPRFYLIQDAVAILLVSGVYRQAQVYHRAGLVYAKYGSGFIRLSKHGTTKASVGLDAYDIPKVGTDRLGRLTYATDDGA